jgi:Uma2 family endonuclease
MKEYWIISPKNKDIQIFSLDKGIYGEPDNFKKEDIIKSKLFQGLEVNLINIFTS